MSNANFGNRAGVTPGATRASFDRAIAECDRQAALPAGHPEVVRAFAWGQRRLIVPSDMTVEQVDELERLAHEGLVERSEAMSDAGESLPAYQLSIVGSPEPTPRPEWAPPDEESEP